MINYFSIALKLYPIALFKGQYVLIGIPGEPLPVTCEEDIFAMIDYPYKKPEERSV